MLSKGTREVRFFHLHHAQSTQMLGSGLAQNVALTLQIRAGWKFSEAENLKGGEQIPSPTFLFWPALLQVLHPANKQWGGDSEEKGVGGVFAPPAIHRPASLSGHDGRSKLHPFKGHSNLLLLHVGGGQQGKNCDYLDPNSFHGLLLVQNSYPPPLLCSEPGTRHKEAIRNYF